MSRVFQFRTIALCVFVTSFVACRGGFVSRGEIIEASETEFELNFSPDSLVAGQAATISFATLGSRCAEPERTDGRWEGDVFIIEPWDWHSGGECVLELVGLDHSITVVFPSAGPATIHVIGIRSDVGDLVTVVREVMVY